ncbi:MAG: hypothetical protein NTX25_10260 [Proteobacteria bacterium]|nr:hypothetical protein [Pseudomonadota bacterium]
MLNTYSRLVSASVFLFMVACQSPSADTVKVQETPKSQEKNLVTDVKTASKTCEDKGFCTREYLPTVCQFEGQNFSASNPCEARKLARSYACEKGLKLDEKAMSCVAKQGAKLEKSR